jgi:hypothetical protein
VIATTRDSDALLELAAAKQVPARRIGETGGDRLQIGPLVGEPWIDAEVAKLRSIWQKAIPRRLEVE